MILFLQVHCVLIKQKVKSKWDMEKNTEIEKVDLEATEIDLEVEEAVDLEVTLVREKCTRQYVLTAHRNARCLLSLPRESLFIAGTVFRSIKDSEY